MMSSHLVRLMLMCLCAEGEAQVRASATAHDPHRQEKEEASRTERRREAPDSLPDRAMQAEISAHAAHSRPLAA
jgi:hypothetical protein